MGLLDNLLHFNLTPEQQQGLMAFGNAMTDAAGPSLMPKSGGQGWSAGLRGYQEGVQASQDRTQQQLIAQLRLKHLQGELGDQERARGVQEQIDAAARDSFMSPEQQALGGGGGPTAANAALIPQMKGGFDTDGFINKVMGFAPLRAIEYKKMLAKAEDEFDPKPQTGQRADGTTFQYLVSKSGKTKILEDTLPRDELKFQDAGNAIYGVNPYTGKPMASLGKGATPGEVMSNRVSQGNLAVAQARLLLDRANAGKPTFNAEAGGFISPPSAANPNGSITPLPGFNKSAKLTEDQAKATGWLVQAENAWRNMQGAGLGADGKPTDAARPGRFETIAQSAPFGMGDGAANMARSPSRQKFLQGASSLSESLLRAATGAGVNESEAKQKIREITPVWGDSDAVIQQKMDSIPLYIETLKVRSGPGAAKAAGVLTPKAGGAPADIADLLNKYGGQ